MKYFDRRYCIWSDEIHEEPATMVPPAGRLEAVRSAHTVHVKYARWTEDGRQIEVPVFVKSEGSASYTEEQSRQVAESEAAAGAISRLWLGNSSARALMVWDREKNEVARDEHGCALLASVAVPGWKEYIKVGEPTWLERHWPGIAKFLSTAHEGDSDEAEFAISESAAHGDEDQGHARGRRFSIGRNQREQNRQAEQKRAQHAADEFPLDNFLMVLTILWIFEEEDPHRKNIGKCEVKVDENDFEEQPREQVGSIDFDRRLWTPVGSYIHGEHFIPSDFAITPQYIENFPVNPGARYGIFSKNKVFMNATSAWSAKDKELLEKLLTQPWPQESKWEAFLQILIMPFDRVESIFKDVFSDEELRDRAIAHYRSRIEIFHAQLLANPNFGNYLKSHMEEIGICQELKQYEEEVHGWFTVINERIEESAVDLLMEAHKSFGRLIKRLGDLGGRNDPVVEFIAKLQSYAETIVSLARNEQSSEEEKKDQLLTMLDDVYCYLKFKIYSNAKPDEDLSKVISRLAKISGSPESILQDKLSHLYEESLEVRDYRRQYGKNKQSINKQHSRGLVERQKLIDRATRQVQGDNARANKLEEASDGGGAQHSPSRVDPLLEEKIRGKRDAEPDAASYRLPLDRHYSDRRRMYFGLNRGDWLSSVRAMNMAVMYTLGQTETIESYIAVEGVWRKLEGEFYRTSDENYYKPEFKGLVRALNDKFYPAVEQRVKKEIADRKKEAKGGFDLAKACYDIMSSDLGRQLDYVQQAFRSLAESNLSEPFNVALLGAVTHCINNTDNFDKMLYAINYANYLLQLRKRMADKAERKNGHPSTRAFDQFVDEAKMLEILQDMNAHKDATPESRGATGDAKADEELGGRASAASRHPSGRMRTQSMRYDEADESAVGDAGAAETKSADVGSRQPSSARRGAAELVHRGGASGQPALVRPRAVMVPGGASTRPEVVQPAAVVTAPTDVRLGIGATEQFYPQPGTDRPAQAPSVAAPHGLHYKKVPEDQAFDWLRDLYNFNGHTESSYFQRKANVVLRAVNERAYSKLETTDVMDWIWKNVFRRNPVARKMDRLAEALFRLSELMSPATPMPDEKRIKKIDELSEFVSKVCPGKFNRTGCTVGLALSVIGGMAVLGYDEFGVEDWFADSIWYTGAAMGLIGLAVTAYSFQKNVSSAVQSMLAVLRKGQGSSCVSVCYDQVTMWADRCASGVTRGVANCFSTLFCADETTLEDHRGGNFEAENTLGDSRAVSEQVHALHGTRP